MCSYSHAHALLNSVERSPPLPGDGLPEADVLSELRGQIQQIVKAHEPEERRYRFILAARFEVVLIRNSRKSRAHRDSGASLV